MTTAIQYKIMQYILYCSSPENLNDIQNEDDEESQILERGTTVNEYQPQTSEVIEEALNVRSDRKSTTMSAVQTRCLDIQEKQHKLEMEILHLRKNNLIDEHQKKMEVLEAELQYWMPNKKHTINTKEPPKRITRQRK